MRLSAFVDTNVLLHYQFFRDVNWPEELGAEEVTLVFAPVVVEELDNRKWAGARRDRERAKKVLKALKDLGLSTTPVEMRTGVEVVALDEEPADALFVHHRLQPRISDDRLLASILAFGEAQGGAAAIVLLTADTGLSVKAPTRQVTVVVPDERLALDEEPDETERELENTRRELAALRTAAPKLRLTVAGGTLAEREVRRFAEFSTTRLGRLLDTWRSRHPYVRTPPDSVVLPGGGRISLEGLAGLPGFWSRKDATERNATIDRVYGDYEAFLRRWPARLNALTRCLDFLFVLQNVGAAPADDVDVLISVDVNGKWLRQLPELPTAPTVPKPRSPLDLISPPDFVSSYGSFDPGHLRLRDDPISGPSILEDEPQNVRYTVKRVKHHVPCELPIVYFQFDSDDDVRSFTVTYRLVAANIREPKSNDLHIKLSVSSAMEPPSPAEWLSRSGEEGGSDRDG